MKHLCSVLSIVLTFAASPAAMAQTVYRCGADGRTYSQEPCADGRKVDAADPRTSQQRADGERAAARERALADNLERQRRTDEASRRPATVAASFKAPRPLAEPVPKPAARHFIRRRIAR